MFMSAISIGPLGVIEGDPLIARAETKLLKRAEKLVVLADGSKFESRGSLVVCPLSRIDIADHRQTPRRRPRSKCCATPAFRPSWSTPHPRSQRRMPRTRERDPAQPVVRHAAVAG